MDFQIIRTDTFRYDFLNAFSYINNVLKNEKAAFRLRDQLLDKIEKLQTIAAILGCVGFTAVAIKWRCAWPIAAIFALHLTTRHKGQRGHLPANLTSNIPCSLTLPNLWGF